ncbi:MAG: guanylate kinase [Pseudomonadota bacterium]
MASGKGSLFVISAPSGSGKTTVCQRTLEATPDLAYSISYTTRRSRSNEKDGVDYVFLSDEKFTEMREHGEFLEWALVHAHYYGTSKKQIDECLSSGRDILLDIDVQGARKVRDSMPDAVLVFILPPSFEILEERLRRRQSDEEEAIRRRLANARDEIKAIREYDYIIINDDLDDAVRKFTSIIQAERCRRHRMLPFLDWLSFQG